MTARVPIVIPTREHPGTVGAGHERARLPGSRYKLLVVVHDSSAGA